MYFLKEKKKTGNGDLGGMLSVAGKIRTHFRAGSSWESWKEP